MHRKSSIETRVQNVCIRYDMTYAELCKLTKWKRLGTLRGWGKKCEEYLQRGYHEISKEK